MKFFNLILIIVGIKSIYADLLNPSETGSYFRIQHLPTRKYLAASIVPSRNLSFIGLSSKNELNTLWKRDGMKFFVFGNFSLGIVNETVKISSLDANWKLNFKDDVAQIQNSNTQQLLDVALDNKTVILSDINNSINPNWRIITAPVYTIQDSTNKYLNDELKFIDLDGNLAVNKWFLDNTGSGYFNIINLSSRLAITCVKDEPIVYLGQPSSNFAQSSWTLDGKYLINRGNNSIYLTSDNSKAGISSTPYSFNIKLA